MQPFWISPIHKENGQRKIYINPMSEKYCTFDCVFCDLGRSIRTAQPQEMPGTDQFIQQLERTLQTEQPDYVMIFPAGEGLINNQLPQIIDLIKGSGAIVGLLSNGYIFNQPEYRQILEKCDEVVGELMVATEADFQKILRPLPGYTLAEHVSHMRAFRQEYQGRFILSLYLLRGYSDHLDAIRMIQAMVQKIAPDAVRVTTPDEGPFTILETRLAEIRADLAQMISKEVQ